MMRSPLSSPSSLPVAECTNIVGVGGWLPGWGVGRVLVERIEDNFSDLSARKKYNWDTLLVSTNFPKTEFVYFWMPYFSLHSLHWQVKTVHLCRSCCYHSLQIFALYDISVKHFCRPTNQINKPYCIQTIYLTSKLHLDKRL